MNTITLGRLIRVIQGLQYYSVNIINQDDLRSSTITYNNNNKIIIISNLFNNNIITNIHISDMSNDINWLNLYTRQARNGGNRRGVCIAGLSHVNDNFGTLKRRLEKGCGQRISNLSVLKSLVEGLLFPLINIEHRSTGFRGIYR